MKRCPQCEFIYEDDQSLCDMDGVLLVFDSRTLPKGHALATVSTPLPGKAQRRNRMAPAFATLILMLVVGSVYYVSTMRNSAQTEYTPASTTAEAPAAVAPAPAPQPTPAPAEARETQPAPASKPTAAPAKKATKSGVAKPGRKKDESKVGSILKKTGKILKKPFKF